MKTSKKFYFLCILPFLSRVLRSTGPFNLLLSFFLDDRHGVN